MDWNRELEGLATEVLYCTMGTANETDGNVATILLADGDYVCLWKDGDSGYIVTLVGCGKDEQRVSWDCTGVDEALAVVRGRAEYAAFIPRNTHGEWELEEYEL